MKHLWVCGLVVVVTPAPFIVRPGHDRAVHEGAIDRIRGNLTRLSDTYCSPAVTYEYDRSAESCNSNITLPLQMM